MSEWCRRCGEGADTVDEIIHDFDCPNEVTLLDNVLLDEDLDEYDDLPTPPDRTHENCTHRRSWRADERCNRRRRQVRAANRALGGL